MKVWIVVALLVAVAVPAHAERRAKSRNAALALSFGTTAAGVTTWIVASSLDDTYVRSADGTLNSRLSQGQFNALVGTGALLFFVGPTTGHIYAGAAWNPGLKYRLIGAGVFFGAFVPGTAIALSEAPASSGTDAMLTFCVVGMVAGGAVYTYGMLRELTTAGTAVDDYNRSLTVVPVAGNSPGVSLVGTF